MHRNTRLRFYPLNLIQNCPRGHLRAGMSAHGRGPYVRLPPAPEEGQADAARAGLVQNLSREVTVYT